MQQISSKEDDIIFPRNLSKKGVNKDLIMQTLLGNDNSFIGNKHQQLSLRNIIRSKNNKEVPSSLLNEEMETSKKFTNNITSNNNNPQDRVNNQNMKSSGILISEIEQSSQSNNKGISNTLKKSNFVKNLSKNKGFKRTIFKNQIDKLIEQVVEFEQETENINENKNTDEEDFLKFVQKRKETKVSNPKLDKYLKFNKLRSTKIDHDDYFETIKMNQASPVKRQKNQFNFNNLDSLTKQIRDFKKFDEDKQKDILAKGFGKQGRVKFPQVPLKKSSMRRESKKYLTLDKLLDNRMLNEKIQKKKTYDFFNQKKFVLMNYNGYSLYCPVIKKENISDAISINELYDLIFQS